MKKRLQFIINPISGGKKKDFVPQLIHQHLDKTKFDYDLWYWEEVEGLKPQIDHLKQEKYDGVIAVGGDGTINQISAELIDTELLMGFVPMGSGNGLTRQLEVPMAPLEAIQHLNSAEAKLIDTGLINNLPFINVAGIGFDAKVSHSFAQSKGRGLLNYGRYVVSEYRETQNMDYRIHVDGKIRDVKAFMLSIANGSQWGNNFFVAPNASLNDGLLDLVIMTKPRLMKIPKLVTDLSRQRIQDNSLVEIIKGKKFVVECSPELAHVDGEPCSKAEKFEIRIKPASLQVFV